MATNYRDLAVPQLSLASSRRLARTGELVPTRDTPVRESSIASSRYTDKSNGSRVLPADNPYTSNLQKTLSSKLSLGGALGHISFANIENNVTFLNQPAGKISCNPYMQEQDDRPPQPRYPPLSQPADKPPRPSSLNRWAEKNKAVVEVKTHEVIEDVPPTAINPESKKMFAPKLLGSHEPGHSQIENEVRGRQLMKELDDSSMAF